MGGNISTDDRPVKSIVASNDIVIFQSGGCPYCADAVSNIKSAGYSPVVIEASSQLSPVSVQHSQRHR